MDDHEMLDHELNRTPVTKTMFDQVSAAAKAAGMPRSNWQRQAYREKLERDNRRSQAK